MPAAQPSFQFTPHFAQRKKSVAGSSAERICTSLKYAVWWPHWSLGQRAAAGGKQCGRRGGGWEGQAGGGGAANTKRTSADSAQHPAPLSC